MWYPVRSPPFPSACGLTGCRGFGRGPLTFWQGLQLTRGCPGWRWAFRTPTLAVRGSTSSLGYRGRAFVSKPAGRAGPSRLWCGPAPRNGLALGPPREGDRPTLEEEDPRAPTSPVRRAPGAVGSRAAPRTGLARRGFWWPRSDLAVVEAVGAVGMVIWVVQGRAVAKVAVPQWGLARGLGAREPGLQGSLRPSPRCGVT